jgi:xanthine dehydrogenase YagT iron-sulfur-binding subunit
MKPNEQEDSTKTKKLLSRRKFLKGAGIGTVGVAVAGSYLAGAEQSDATPADMNILGPGAVPLSLNVNGKALSVQAEPRETLADVLRNRLHLTGTKLSCERGACGACTVLVDGAPICSCLTLAHDVAGRKVETIEGLMDEGQLNALQKSFIDHDGMQCGFCTSGMIMSSTALLRKTPSPTLDQVREELAGNLCRCGTYPKVFDAVLDATKNIGKKR